MINRQSLVLGVSVAVVIIGISLDTIAQNVTAQGQAQAFRDYVESQTIHANGRDQPQLIPERVRVRSFAMHLDLTDSGASMGLDTADAARVAEFAEETRRARDDDNEAFDALRSRQCDEISGKTVGEIDGIRFTASVVEFQQRIDAELVARFRSMMNAVSPAGRQRIDAYIESEIIDGMGWGEMDTLAVATRFPDWAAMNAMRVCGMLDVKPQMPVIVSSSRSGGLAASVVSGTVSSFSSGPTLPQDDLPGATITFTRVVSPSELRELLAGQALELRGLDYREVGPAGGHLTFSPGVDAATAIGAAEEQLIYPKRAEAFAIAHGVASVYVPGIGPMGAARPLQLDPASGRFDASGALRPTREELDAMSLPPCIADERIEQAFDVSGPDRALIEAACGLRTYAIRVLGERSRIESFARELGELVASVAFDSATD